MENLRVIEEPHNIYLVYNGLLPLFFIIIAFFVKEF